MQENGVMWLLLDLLIAIFCFLTFGLDHALRWWHVYEIYCFYVFVFLLSLPAKLLLIKTIASESRQSAIVGFHYANRLLIF